MRIFVAALCLAASLAITASPVWAASTAEELKELREEVQRLRDQVNANKATNSSAPSSVDTALDSKYGPDAKATTRNGKLTMSGLLQVWYYSIQNDSRGAFHNPGAGIFDTNQPFDNDSFRIRRAEIGFEVAVHENVSAFIKIDPAAEAASFPQLAVGPHRLANVSPEFNAVNGPFLGATTANVLAVQTGAGAIPTLLQDAIINVHGLLPHHDITTGQMVPFINEENIGNNGELDFVERSYIGDSVSRDMGAVIHGSWWCNDKKGGVYEGLGDSGRLQYWLGTFNGAGNYHNTAGSQINRSDDNDQKDFVGTLLVRPLWDDCMGHLELGAAAEFGKHGESGAGLQATAPVNGLDRAKTWASRYDAWIKYFAPGMLKGLWVKGEYLQTRDRNAPGSVIDVTAADFQLGDGGGLADQGQAFTEYGYWGAIGYKLSDSPLLCADSKRMAMFKGLELAFRYEDAPNVIIARPGDPNYTNVYHSKVYTPGINYYISGHHAKIQANYNFVQGPDGPQGAPFHHTRSDSFAMNFQVMW